MRYTRHLFATLAAIALHWAALSYAKPNLDMTIDTQNGQSAMQIQFVSAPKPAQEAPKAEQFTPQLDTQAPIEQKAVPAVPPKPETKPKVSEKRTAKPVLKPKSSNSVTTPKPPLTMDKPAPTAKSEPEQKKSAEQQPDRTTQVKPAAEPIKKETPPHNKAEPIPEITPEKSSTVSSVKENAQPKLLTKPKFSAKPTPVSYPRLARNRGWEGRTVVEVWIDEQGHQIKTNIHSSSGHAALDKSALAAIKKWKFAKHDEQGRSIAHRVHIPIDFKLN